MVTTLLSPTKSLQVRKTAPRECSTSLTVALGEHGMLGPVHHLRVEEAAGDAVPVSSGIESILELQHKVSTELLRVEQISA